ncbi:hypothetical protein B0O99DRAFT_626873 [Bisporella sp. PMI_857]|nr:hypothetical protein B0O99DRAFT_626873 [Bisporella sp. PMI_857]
MATLEFLPSTTYRPASAPGQVPRRRPSLNTIIEVDEESHRGSNLAAKMGMDRGRNRSPQDRSPKEALVSWHLSPLSDHFPTPRGNHFLSAPICPSTPASTDRDTSSPAPSSGLWTRQSFMTEATDFDDLYDASSDEDSRRKSSLARRPSIRQSKHTRRASTESKASRESLSNLVIPPSKDQWPGMEAYKSLTSPVPPTPPPKVPMSPAIFSYLQSQEAPSSSAPPSLDGSLTSEELAAISIPSTPDLGNNSEDEGDWSGGVQLQPEALATLQVLAGENYECESPSERVIEIPSRTNSPMREMQQSPPPLFTNIHRNNSVIVSPGQQRALNSLTKLEIPSPGGFFSALSPRARHTWHLVPITPESAAPPSSSTAESFYKMPWQAPPIEQIIEAHEAVSDDLPTARPTPAQLQVPRPELRHDNSDETVRGVVARSPVEEDIVADEMLRDYEPGYASKLESVATANLDRTGLWLAAQSNFLAELINPVEERDDEAALLKRAISVKSQVEEAQSSSEPHVSSTPKRKTVRFSEMPTTSEEADINVPKPVVALQENAYHRAFQGIRRRSRARDTFIHRTPRFEAIQSQRVTFPSSHRSQLLGKYQLSVVPMSAKRRMSANVARGDEITPEDPEKLKEDKEYEALQQMQPALWNVAAVRMLNGGRLIASPVAKKLARLSCLGPTANGRERARILDLGGEATGAWAWHCASEYPNCKVYTVTTKALRQLSNSNIRGPKNHRQVAVNKLTKLPFGDSTFDLISAREAYTILKSSGENGEDEWDACLKECMRILKPGGYLEFSVMDSDIVNAGPLGLAKSVEFGFNLKTLGYDPTPTKTFLPKLKKAGFVGIKRAWVFLPMGSQAEKGGVRDSRVVELEAMVTGSTNAVAGIAGVVGGWAWEKWLLRCKVQTVGDEGAVEGVQDVIEEGRACGAGWRTCSGWARKAL